MLEEIWGVLKMLADKSTGMRLLGRRKRKWENII